MDYRRLGESGLLVSDICLGTMTFGGQVDEATSLRLLDRAYDAGITFFDSAEMYAVPPTAESFGRSEAILGAWLATKPRDAVIVATKVSGACAGPGRDLVGHVRGGTAALDWHHMVRAVEGSLGRLGTEYIDLYQTHWPDRDVPMEAQIEALARLVEAGKVRYPGVSNESPWGLTRLLAAAEAAALPKPASLQNNYSLLRRGFEDAMREVVTRERVGMMAYSPLAGGVLTGKYSGGALPEGARMTVFPERFRSRYGHPKAVAAADRYVAIAREAGLDPAAMAIAWMRSRPGVTAALPGCTLPEHLEAIIAAGDLTLSADVLAALDAVHADMPNPVR